MLTVSLLKAKWRAEMYPTHDVLKPTGSILPVVSSCFWGVSRLQERDRNPVPFL
jgi:hypothetical protein